MSNDVYPDLPGLTYPITKTPIWRTKVVSSVSGMEQRARFMSAPFYRWDLTYDLLRMSTANPEFQMLFDFYNAHFGKEDDFLFNDKSDNTANNDLCGVGNGSVRAFQLIRTQRAGGFAEPIQAPATIAAVTVNGVATTSYTLGGNGVITFTTAPSPGAQVRWSGTYYWRVRFDDDELDFEEFDSMRWEIGTVTLYSVKRS